jgi:hypothetical protein
MVTFRNEENLVTPMDEVKYGEVMLVGRPG